MSVSTHTSLGEIIKIQLMEKGYTKIVLLVNIPYKSIYATFNLWPQKVKKFLTGDEQIRVGDYI